MSHKPAVKYQKVDIHEDIENKEAFTHPLESPNFLVQWFQYIFHIWVFKLVSVCQNSALQINDTAQTPKCTTLDYAYERWTKLYDERKKKKLSTTTLSMMFHTQKYKLIVSQIGQILGVLGVFYFQYIIVRDHLYPSLTELALKAELADSSPELKDDFENDKMHLLWDVSKWAILNFCVAVLAILIRAISLQMNAQIVTSTVGCIQYQLFNKLLKIDLNEPDKLQLLNVAGAEMAALINKYDGILGNLMVLFSLVVSFEILLYKTVGNASFFGLLFMIFIGLPFQLFSGVQMAVKMRDRLIYSAKRVQLITQLISGVRFLKCNVSEMALFKQINEYRLNELKYVKSINTSLIIMFLLNLLIPSLMVIIVLAVYVYVFDNTITALTVVSLVMQANFAQMICKMLPMNIALVAGTIVFTTRIDKFLNKKERATNAITDGNSELEELNKSNKYILQIKNGFFQWNAKETTDTFMLKNVNLNIANGKLVAIIGKVGSGKTSLVEAILGEMPCDKGSISQNVNKYGYCSQSPFIQNATFRDNIIMDLKFDAQRYKQVLFAADLESDLKQLPFADLTEIGSEGINLSGGQKMRLCFARTLYRKYESDLFIFDDPLSSVDIYVGKHMFFNGIIKYLQLKQSNKTCLMTVNSHLYLLKYFDEIIVVENGEIKLHTETNTLLSEPKTNDLYQKYAYLLPDLENVKNKPNQSEEEKVDILNENEIKEKDIEIMENIAIDNDSNHLYFNEQSQLMLPDWNVYKDIVKYSLMKVDPEQEFMNNDTATKVRISKFKLTLMILAIVILFLFCSALIFCDVWLVVWRENVDPIDPQIPFQVPKLIEISGNQSDLWYLGLWTVALLFVVFMTFILLNAIGNILIKTSHSIFSKTLLNILKCNTLFFDLIPRGQLLNVLSSDPNTLDGAIPVRLFFSLMIWSSILGYFAMIAICTPTLLILFIFFVFPICYIMYHKFTKSVYALTALWKISFSPILSLFDESISGLDSIRAYKLETFFQSVITKRIDTANQCKYNALSVIGWSTLYFTSFIYFCVLISTIYFALRLLYFDMSQDTDLRFIMLSIWWYTLIGSLFLSALFISVEFTTNIASVQKMFFYCDEKNIDNIYKSKKQITSLKNANDTWPSVGDLNLSKLKLKYRENFEIVLDIDKEIKIKTGTKLAICGRTGSGKSSILVSIFRLFEPCIDSRVEIDKLNIFELGLFEVRSKISIIMQTPIMFTGTLRFNLDPFNQYTDNQIWNALKDVQLFELIQNRENCLHCDVGENGSNFSVGEAQLICFARAILKQTKIFFMDEPTSSIDKATDKVIQNLIRSEKFDETTIICIAHRLQTILDYDYILLLEKGKVLEYNTPRKLLKNKQSQFYNLLRVSNLYHK